MAKKPASPEKPLKLMHGDKAITINYPLITVKDRAYMYASYLTYNCKKAKFNAETSKRFTVNAPTRRVLLNLDSLIYQVNGQTRQMSVKPILVNGLCYVPLDVMNAVLPGKFTYNAKTQTVRYDPPQKTIAALQK